MEKLTIYNHEVRDSYTAKEILAMAREAGLTVTETVRILQQRLPSAN